MTDAELVTLYLEQIAYLQAENERLALMVAIHYTPAEQIDTVTTEWSVRSQQGRGPTYQTMTDAQELKAGWDRSQPGIDHPIQYRFVTPWKDAK